MPSRRAASLTLGLGLSILAAGCSLFRAAPAPAPIAITSTTTQSGDVTVTTLSNGITLLHKSNPSNAIVAVRVLSRWGAVNDPDEKIGRAHLMMRLLEKGTSHRDADEISDTLEGLGASVNTSDNYDTVGASLRCVRADLKRAFEVFSDVLLNPTFPIEEIDAEKQRVLAEIRMRDDRTPLATMKRFRSALFAPHPYGRPLEGEPETVMKLGQIDLAEAHEAAMAPENLIVAVVGDISAEDARELIEEHFGHLPRGATSRTEARKSFAPRATREEFSRDVEQGFVVLGHTTGPATDPDSAALDVATAILGQGMSSRLFTELRDKRSLAYMVGASTAEYQHGGMFLSYIGTSPETVDAAEEGLWEQVRLLRAEPVAEDELERAKNYLAGGYLREHETNAGQARYLAYWQFLGLGPEADDQYTARIRAVTTRDVMRVANKYFTDPTVVILRPLASARGAEIPAM